MITKLTNGKIIENGTVTEGKSLYLQDGVIMALTEEALPHDAFMDVDGQYISAGFIDIHTHGGGGFDVMDGGTEPILGAADMHAQHGTTAILPTSLACSTPVLMQFLTDMKTAMQKRPNILGAHLEGPYFALEQSGAQNPDYIKPPCKEEYDALLDLGKGVIRRWSFSPELEGSEAFCRTLLEHGVIPSIAHTNAELCDVERVYNIGCRFITHLYSCMSTITRHKGFRHLGVIESAYYFDDMEAEIIADGKHLPPELLKLIVKLKGTDRICLVTDSMRGAGMPDGESLLGRKGEAMPCVIEDGVAKLPDRSAFAGSVATADRLVRTMVQQAGLNVAEAVKMMTKNPARLLGLTQKGALQPGYDADVVVFDENINVSHVFIQGTQVGTCCDIRTRFLK